MIVKKHIQHAVVRQLTREVGGDATYETAMKQAAFLGKRVMTKTCRHMVVGDKLDTVFMSYICTAGMEAMREMANKMDLAKITTRTVWVLHGLLLRRQLALAVADDHVCNQE
ncbi:hypothetical protein CLOP_g5851 [Closterium sp. NIES-67]|nr:hypothetical protein CLOP_g5851 [Closterium sp. NIES-67]